VPCLINGTGRQSVQKYGVYRSTVYYHQNTPTFMETVKMTIPDGDTFERAHLHFLVSHCKDDAKTPRITKDGSFSFLPLAAPGVGVALPDGEHVLTGYKLLPGMDKGTSLPSYLRMEPSKLVEHKVKSILNGSAESESLTVFVRLVSTKKTQIAELHALINWRTIGDVAVLAATFEKLIRHKWTDLVKMLRELLDALIALLRDGNCKVPDKVYYFLAHVLNEASKPQNKTAYLLVQDYLAKLTHSALGDLHAILVKHVRRHLTWVSTKPEPPPDPGQSLVMGLANTLNATHLLVNVIKVSYQKAEAVGQGQGGGAAFLEDVGSMLDQITGFFDLAKPVWVKTSQSKALRRLAPTLEHLHGFLPQPLIAAKVFKLMAKLSVYAPGGGLASEALLLDKLLLLRHLVRGYVFQDPPSRALLLPLLVDLLGGHLRTTGAPRQLAVAVLNDCLHLVQRDRLTHPEDFQDAVQHLSGLMSEVLSAVDSALDDDDSESASNASPATKALSEAINRDAEGKEAGGDGAASAAAFKPVSDAATALLTLVHLQGRCGDPTVMDMNVAHLRGLLSAMGQLMTVQVYPADWLVMTMLQFQVTLQVLDFAAGHLNAAGFLGVQDIRASTADGLLNPAECDALFFVVGLTLLREESLDTASRTMSPARKHFIVEVGKYGDLRAKVVEVLQTRWANVDVSKRGEVAMVDLLVKPLLELVSSSSPTVAAMAKDMFFELLQAEFAATANFLTIGRHAVDAIDSIMQTLNKQSAANEASASQGAVADPALLVLFRDDLLAKFSADPALNTPDAMRFLHETTELFSLLRDLSRYPKTASFEDERVYAYTKLMEFLGRLKRFSTSIKYAHALAKELSALGLYSEAACALLLHAKLLQCDSLPADPPAGDALAQEDWVSVGAQLAATVGCQLGCHGDCGGPGGGRGKDAVRLDESELFPAQTALQRREKIYEQAMDLFERGQQWEMALELANALQQQWAQVTLEYRKLPPLLRRCADW
jgi:dedicator of cytokinesis protein 3